MPAYDDGGRLKMRRAPATRDHAAAARWRPGAITLLVGAGIWVLDLDRKNGVDGVAWYEREIGAVPERAAVETPRGGLHVYFSGEAAGSTDKLARGVDVIGSRGNTPAPGSETRDGPYRALSPRFAIAKPPTRLMEALATTQRESPRISKPLADPAAWSRVALSRFAREIEASRYPDATLNRLAFLAGTREAFIEDDTLDTLVEAAVMRGIGYARAWTTAARAFEAGRRKL